jgi:hypothetical protein
LPRHHQDDEIGSWCAAITVINKTCCVSMMS